MAPAPRSRIIATVACCFTFAACETGTQQHLVAPPGAPTLHSFDPERAQWSAAVNMGEPVNSAFNENNSSLDPDGLSIYISSNRPGGLGGNDIWVVQRDCTDCPWKEPAVNLGPVFNNSAGDGGVTISQDGHMMIYQSARAGGFGATDLWIAHRDDVKDDFAWKPPVNLGPLVNTANPEQAADYVVAEGMLYFNRGNIMALQADIWRVPMTPRGVVHGAAEPVAVLNTTFANDAAPAISSDGREMIFWSFPRPTGPGDADLWVSTRRSVAHDWGVPVLVPGPVNTADGEVAPSVTHDGRSMIFFSDRPGGFGGFDLWMSTRMPSGRE